MIFKRFKPAQSDIDHIVGMLSFFYPVSRDLAEEFHKHAFAIQLDKDQYLLRQGEICKSMYFIKTGAVMAYTEHHQKRITTYISVENEFVSSLSGLYGEQPSQEAIVAIEPSILLGVHTDILLEWYQRFFDLNFIIRKVYENYYRDAQERSFIVRMGSAKERYRYFLKSHSETVSRLPVKYVASLLDIKPETLIRIKKQEGKDSKGGLHQIIKQIDAYIVENKSFKDQNFKSSNLSAALNIPVYLISDAIKEHYKLGFNNYLNQHRVHYFKAEMNKQYNLQNFTIEAIALQSGFVSRSGFYKAFKKHEGISPKEYMLGILSTELLDSN